MHPQSLSVFSELFDKLPNKEVSVLDVGSADINGTYHSVLIPWIKSYTGVDLQKGPNVDIVLDDPYKLPFADNSFDLVISGQALEHSECFWLMLEEIFRVAKSHIIIIVPSAGAIHRFPVDCYRFLPDSFVGWSKRWNSQLVELIHKTDSNISQWCDVGGLFKKL